MSQVSAPPDLGTLSTLPLELRERIYDLVLNFNEPPADFQLNPNLHEPPFDPLDHLPNCTCADRIKPQKPSSPPKLSLLLVSKFIHNEARIVLFRINNWKIAVEDDDQGCLWKQEPNASIMGRPGWMMQLSHTSGGRDSAFTPLQLAALDRDNIWAELRFVHVSVGSGQGYGGAGIREYDILPWKRQTKLGPERPSFIPLLKVVENVCELLRQCRQLHVLRITLRSIEKTPGSMEMVLDPFRSLRGVKRTSTVIMGMQDDMWVDWNLKGSYGRYLNKILGMPEGAKPPKYVGDKKEPDQSDTDIFDTIGARWCGGQTFAYPSDDEDDDEDEDEDDEEYDDDDLFEDEDEMAEFGEFLEYMGMPGPMMGGLTFGPPPFLHGGHLWETESDEYIATDSGEEDEGEDHDSMPDLIPLSVETGPGPFPDDTEENESGEGEEDDDMSESSKVFGLEAFRERVLKHWVESDDEEASSDEDSEGMPDLIPIDVQAGAT